MRSYISIFKEVSHDRVSSEYKSLFFKSENKIQKIFIQKLINFLGSEDLYNIYEINDTRISVSFTSGKALRNLCSNSENYKNLKYDNNISTVKCKPIFEKFANKNGYYVSSIPERYEIEFTAKIGKQLTKIPRYLYHMTALTNKENILKSGLLPFSGSRKDYLYPKRIYLLTEFNKAGMLYLWDNIVTTDSIIAPQTKDLPSVVVFKIDTKKLNKNNKFYFDEDLGGVGVYTNESIPTTALSIAFEGKL